MQKVLNHPERPVIGRYAPSPTGDLHLGNLRTALIAWLHARTQAGQFFMRMEDIDTPRVVAGSDKKILKDLEWLGLDWDGDVVYQSQRLAHYRDALNELSLRGLTYPCFCSRKDIQQAASAPHTMPGVYPGTCENLSSDKVRQKSADKAPATRLRVGDELKHDCGDFVLHRADGLYAYQLVVVVDDLDQGISDVVRGDDLAHSTARQLYLAELLSGDNPAIHYHHVTLMLDESGNRMSKRDGSFCASQWRQKGGSAESMLGMLAHSIGLIDQPEPLAASELLSDVSYQELERVLSGS